MERSDYAFAWNSEHFPFPTVVFRTLFRALMQWKANILSRIIKIYQILCYCFMRDKSRSSTGITWDVQSPLSYFEQMIQEKYCGDEMVQVISKIVRTNTVVWS